MSQIIQFVPDTKLHTLDTVTARNLQEMEFPPIEWVVPGYIVEGLTILAGKPKLGKSWLALDWALASAYGGIACGSIECQAGDVLYLALEDNKRRLKSRMQQLLPDGVWPDRLELITNFRRLNEGGLDDLRDWIRSVERPRLIVIDTLVCVRPARGSKDNPYETDYAALAPLQELASETNVAIVVVHHVRKLESDDPLDTVSGTTGLTGAADSILILRRDAQGMTLYGRGRDIGEIETAMQFDPTTGRWAVLGAAAEIRKSDERLAIIEALKDAGASLSPNEIAGATNMKDNNVRFLLHKMSLAGEVQKDGRGRYRPPE
jgi:AAA domain